MEETKTLGRQLQELQALGKSYYKDHTPDEKLEASRRAVAKFFTDAQEHIVRSIAGGGKPEPYRLGSSPRASNGSEAAASALATYQWAMKASSYISERSPYRDIWDQFVAWAVSQQLEVGFKHQHDGVGVHSWYELEVTPNAKQLGPAPDLVTEPVTLPRALVRQFGSAQAYLAHLQKQGGL